MLIGRSIELSGSDASTVKAAVLARLFDCDERTIRRLAQGGVVIKAGRDRYVLAGSIKGYVKHLREQAAGRASEDKSIDVMAESGLLKREQRELTALKRKLLAGELVRREALETMWGIVTGAVQTGVRSIPSDARHRLPHLSASDAEVLAEICRDKLESAALSGEPPPVGDAPNEDEE